jgi:hypothetical protein
VEQPLLYRTALQQARVQDEPAGVRQGSPVLEELLGQGEALRLLQHHAGTLTLRPLLGLAEAREHLLHISQTIQLPVSVVRQAGQFPVNAE